MSERDRPSLSGLAIKRPLAERGRPVVSIDEAESALLGVEPVLAPAANAASTSPIHAVPAAVQQEVSPAVLTDTQLNDHTDVQSTVLSSSLLRAKKKQIKIAWTFKIPHALHQELSAVASHNDLTMSDIVIEAIQFHLPNFPHPPKR